MWLHIVFPNNYIKNVFKKKVKPSSCLNEIRTKLIRKLWKFVSTTGKKKTLNKFKTKQNKEISQNFKTMTWNLDLALWRKINEKICGSNKQQSAEFGLTPIRFCLMINS